MTRVIISHGTLGHPSRAWFPWLTKELQKREVEVIAPYYPTPENQSLESWREALHDLAGPLRESDILVGHSIGSVFSLRLLERSAVIVAGAFLAAVCPKPIGNLRFDALNDSFISAPYDWPAIRKHARLVKLYSSDNDQFIPIEGGVVAARALKVELNVIKGGGHLNADSGFAEWPELLQDILLAINPKNPP